MISSCTEVIELDLNNSAPQIVIEGNINTSSDSAIIKITKTVNFDSDNSFPAVNGAFVLITDNIGHIDTLIETEPGIYKADIRGISGNTYFLNVSVGDINLSSVSSIPNQVNFDSLVINEVPASTAQGPNSEKRHEVLVYFKDPANEKNYYRFVEYKNGKISNRLYIYDDRLSNGSDVVIRLRNNTSRYDSADVISFEMQCIDQFVYEYFNSFSNLNGGPMNASAPANPYSNILGSDLGYFSAHTAQRLTVIFP